jgi:peptidoglycan hydrolase CwlO-like protein
MSRENPRSGVNHHDPWNTIVAKCYNDKLSLERRKTIVKDLEDTLKKIIANKQKFNFTDLELQNREKQIATLKKRLESSQSDSESAEPLKRSSQSDSESAEPLKRSSRNSYSFDADPSIPIEIVVDSPGSNAQNELEQEKVLDSMSHYLKLLNAHASDINEELDSHNHLIGETNSNANDTQNRLDGTIRKVDLLITRSGAWKYWCIGFLVVLCIVLFFAVVYT